MLGIIFSLLFATITEMNIKLTCNVIIRWVKQGILLDDFLVARLAPVEQQAARSSAVSAAAPASAPMQLSDEQKARIERNRQQALAIRAKKTDGAAA